MQLDSYYYNDEPKTEFSIRAQAPHPAFISKSMVRKDIVVGNFNQYFYTEVGENEEGNVYIKFDRGSGKIYGRIVEKDRDEGQGWMNKIILPDENHNEIQYNYYNRNIFYGQKSTHLCRYGCYLIIKIEPNFSDDYYKNDKIIYPMTLSIKAGDAKSIITTQDDRPVVSIPLNEFIVGNALANEKEFEIFYSLIIPYDCEVINIEFLCESSYLYVNVGDKKPKINDYDFHYQVMEKYGILKINKTEILEKLKKNEVDSIKNVQLTLAIGAKYLDDGVSAKYSFRIRALRSNKIDLISLTIDQETLCKVKGTKDNCYFFISENRILDEQNNIFFHAINLPNVEFNYYASEVSKDIITNGDNAEIESYLPKKDNCKWSNNNSRANYLYIDNSEIQDKNNSYILLNLEVYMPYNNNEETITLLHTFYSYKGTILPNPYRMQLFLVNNNNLNELIFKFDNDGDDLIIRLRSVSGKGSVYWDKSDNIQINGNNINLLSDSDSDEENIYYYFNNPGDIVSLTLGKDKKDRFPLHFKNENQNIEKNNSNELPGFGFLCFYEKTVQNLNKYNYNFLNFGANSIYNFRHSDFPFMFYARIPDTEHTFDVNIKLISKTKKYLSNNMDQGEELEIEIPLYDKYKINATILKEEEVYLKNIDPTKIKMTNGKYDPIDNIFKIQFTSEKIKSCKVDGNNYVFIVIDKGTDQTLYNDITMEISLLSSNEDSYITEINKYIYGKIPKDEKKYSRYELSRVSNFYKYMRIEFSANNNNIYFTLNNFQLGEKISNIKFKENNYNLVSKTYSNGKTVTIIEFVDNKITSVFLSIFNEKNDESSNFVFKYDISDQNNFINITTVDNSIEATYEQNRSTLDITLPFIEPKLPGAKVNYIIKLIEDKDYSKNESLKTISLIDSSVNKVYKISNPQTNKKITLTEINKNTIYYVAINAYVETNTYNESFSYSYLNNPTKYENKTESKTTVIILGSVFGGVGLIGLVFLIYCLVLKKGNLIKSSKLEKLTKKMNPNSNGELIVND